MSLTDSALIVINEINFEIAANRRHYRLKFDCKNADFLVIICSSLILIITRVDVQ